MWQLVAGNRRLDRGGNFQVQLFPPPIRPEGFTTLSFACKRSWANYNSKSTERFRSTRTVLCSCMLLVHKTVTVRLVDSQCFEARCLSSDDAWCQW